MPRKTKEQKELENNIKKAEKKATTTTKSAKKATTKSTTKKSTSPKTKTTTKAKSTSTKKFQKTSSATKTKTKAVKTSSKKSTPRKKVEIVEYYDLPYRYNQTIVKVLAQTPTNLFIYWDISDKDRKNFENQYGEDFFQTTKPILIVHNDTIRL